MHFCVECGSPVEYGRPDKKYCSAKCKNAWHNREMRLYKEIHSRVSTSMAKNYAILDNLLQEGVTSIKLNDIQSMGFNIHVVTSLYSTKPKSMDLGCYDIIYTQSSLKIFNIHKVLSPTTPLHP